MSFTLPEKFKRPEFKARVEHETMLRRAQDAQEPRTAACLMALAKARGLEAVYCSCNPDSFVAMLPNGDTADCNRKTFGELVDSFKPIGP